MGNKDITDFNEAQLRKRAASKEELNICLTNNYAFQKIFKNEEIVKGFLIALLHLKETDIEELEVTDPFVEGEVKEEKEGILDVKLILNGGKKINIEMQNTYQEDWAERSLFYNCRMFTEGLKKGESYYELPPCIHVGILDFNYLKSPGFYHRILLKDAQYPIFCVRSVHSFVNFITSRRQAALYSATEIFLPISSLVIPNVFSTPSSTGSPCVSHPALRLTRYPFMVL